MEWVKPDDEDVVFLEVIETEEEIQSFDIKEFKFGRSCGRAQEEGEDELVMRRIENRTSNVLKSFSLWLSGKLSGKLSGVGQKWVPVMPVEICVRSDRENEPIEIEPKRVSKSNFCLWRKAEGAYERHYSWCHSSY